MLKVSDIIKIKIDKIVFGGEGLGYFNDFAIFVPMSVPEDELEIEIISIKKTYARGLIKRIIKASPERTDNHKFTFEDFYGCDFAMLKYESQLKYKRLMVEEVMKKIAGLSDIEIKEGSADFRLLDQAVVEVIRQMKENEPFLRGMVPWVGFNQVYVPYTAQARHSGETKYTIKKMFQLALSGVTSFSVKPLYFAVFLGFFFSLLSVLYVPYVIYSFLNGSEISGWASLIMTIVFFGGLQLIILGIIGVYIGKIFTQTKERPAYIIQEKHL